MGWLPTRGLFRGRQHPKFDYSGNEVDESIDQIIRVPPGKNMSKVIRTARTRIVCISDTHNSTVKLPKGDVLIHAGDLTNQGSYSEVGSLGRHLSPIETD